MMQVQIAERCCAALGDTGRALYLRRVSEAAEEARRAGLEDASQHFMVRAKMAMLEKQVARPPGLGARAGGRLGSIDA